MQKKSIQDGGVGGKPTMPAIMQLPNKARVFLLARDNMLHKPQVTTAIGCLGLNEKKMGDKVRGDKEMNSAPLPFVPSNEINRGVCVLASLHVCFDN